MEILSLSPKSPSYNQTNTENDEEEEEKQEDHSTTTTTASTGSSLVALHGQGKKKMKNQASKSYRYLLLVNYLSMFLGSISSSLLSRFYFIHGGSSKWISTWVQSAGFPLLLPLIYIPHLLGFTQRPPFSHFTRTLVLLSVFVGLMVGVNNFLFSWGISYLSVSTSSLLLSSQLAFNLLLSVILVKQKITFSNLNCVILLTLSSVLLALGSSRDRPNGVTKAHYFMGFFSILGAGLLFALYLPVMEMVYKRVQHYAMVVEMQLLMELAAWALATVGMAVDGGFGEMREEARSGFDLGPVRYGLTVGFNIVSWQMCFMGTAGMVFLTTSLTGGICMTAFLPMNVVGGAVIYRDAFEGIKVVSTLLCLWGFCSYVYGEYKKTETKELQGKETEDEERQMVEIGSL